MDDQFNQSSTTTAYFQSGPWRVTEICFIQLPFLQAGNTSSAWLSASTSPARPESSANEPPHRTTRFCPASRHRLWFRAAAQRIGTAPRQDEGQSTYPSEMGESGIFKYSSGRGLSCFHRISDKSLA